MRGMVFFKIDHGRIRYELEADGRALVVLPSDATEAETCDVLTELRKHYRRVTLDEDGIITVEDSWY